MMTREEAEDLATEESAKFTGLIHVWGEVRLAHEAGFMAAYDLLAAPKPTQRSWKIVGGDASAMGYGEAFTDLNQGFEAVEFLRRTQPETLWQLKEVE